MSELKTNKISPAVGTGVTLGDSGDTFTIPAGATIVNSGTATGFVGGGLKEYSRGAKNGVITINSATAIDPGIRANLNPTSTDDIIRFQHFWSWEDGTSGTAQDHQFWKSLDGGTYTQHIKWADYMDHWPISGTTARSTSSLWWTGTAGDLGWSTGVLSLGVKIALQSSDTWNYNCGFGVTANGAPKQMSFVEAFRYSASVYTTGTDA